MMNPWRKSCGLLMPLLFVVSACGSSSPRPFKPTPVFFLAIEGPTSILSGETAAFKAILTNAADQSRRDVTQEALWSSSNPGLVKIERGSVSGLFPGATVVEARFEQWNAGKSVSIATRPDAAAAALVIESPSVQVNGPDSFGSFGYGVRFRLRETSGENFARIGEILVIGPNGSESTGPGCWRDALIVPAGGTLDTFYTDEGLNWLLYCAPGVAARSSTASVRVIVNYVDSGGRSGKVETVITR